MRSIVPCVVVVALAGAATAAEPAAKPNVVFLLCDDLGYGDLHCFASPVIQTPNLDRLCEEGVIFDRALCASPLCAPSRAALLTGLLPSRSGVYDNAAELPASVPTVAHHLRSLGYRTVLTGKMHFVGPDQLHGFEERPMPDVYPAGLDWIRKVQGVTSASVVAL